MRGSLKIITGVGFVATMLSFKVVERDHHVKRLPIATRIKQHEQRKNLDTVQVGSTDFFVVAVLFVICRLVNCDIFGTMPVEMGIKEVRDGLQWYRS